MRLKIDSRLRRTLVSAGCWLSSGYALLLCVQSIYISVMLALSKGTPVSAIPTLLLMGFPWVALAVMNIGWIKNKKVAWWWPILGTLSALTALLLTLGIGFVLAPFACLLAIYLVMFHIKATNVPPNPSFQRTASGVR